MGNAKRVGTVLVSGMLIGALAVAGRKQKPALASSQEADPVGAMAAPLPQAPFLESSLESPSESQEAFTVAPVRWSSRLRLVVVGSGFVLLALVAGGIWLTFGSTFSSPDPNPRTNVPAPPAKLLSAGKFTACPVQPAAAVASQKDGRFPLLADVSGLIAADIGSFLVLGKEFAASGNARDAEVAFLMSCGVADNLKGANSLESADAKYQLGSHYAAVAVAGGSNVSSSPPELLKRSERLFSDSSRIYIAQYGAAHEKARLATAGLEGVRQAIAQAVSTPAAKPWQEPQAVSSAAVQSPVESAPRVVSAPAPDVAPAPVAKVNPVPVRTQNADRRLRPSFDCANARSRSERMICSDVELARLDRELGRVYARAKKSTSDRAAFRRQQEQEWRMRESICRDRDCLLRWYARRHQQLTQVIEGQGAMPPPTYLRSYPADMGNLYRGG